MAQAVDLVLIMEYFDESLILLKRKLCWELDDMLYFRLNQRAIEYKENNISDDQQVTIFKAQHTLSDLPHQTKCDRVSNESWIKPKHIVRMKGIVSSRRMSDNLCKA